MITYRKMALEKEQVQKDIFIISHTLKEVQNLLFIFDFLHQSIFNVFFLLLIQQLLLSKSGFTFSSIFTFNIAV